MVLLTTNLDGHRKLASLLGARLFVRVRELFEAFGLFETLLKEFDAL
jgi:hypothetical protein